MKEIEMITLNQAYANLPVIAAEGDAKTVANVQIGKTIKVVKFGFYDGKWQRWQGRATSEKGIEYNACCQH